MKVQRRKKGQAIETNVDLERSRSCVGWMEVAERNTAGEDQL